ncbi:hypothetical protein H8356DRAFT_1618905 [Neocallimastix lanati (nom. inval.)]|nr:hypothetical protein H8356DRAFT_1618905 [Neocallimastix sp. JGI-2020a]
MEIIIVFLVFSFFFYSNYLFHFIFINNIYNSLYIFLLIHNIYTSMYIYIVINNKIYINLYIYLYQYFHKYINILLLYIYNY